MHPSHFCFFIIFFNFVSLSSLIFTFNFQSYSFPKSDETLPSHQYFLGMHIESEILSRGHELCLKTEGFQPALLMDQINLMIFIICVLEEMGK